MVTKFEGYGLGDNLSVFANSDKMLKYVFRTIDKGMICAKTLPARPLTILVLNFNMNGVKCLDKI